MRLAVVASSPGASLLREIDCSATGLRKMLFLGGEVGVSHSGTSGCAVAIESWKIILHTLHCGLEVLKRV